MSTMRRFIESAAAQADVRKNADGTRISVILAPRDAEMCGINRAIRLELIPSPLSVVAHYTDAGRFEHRAGRWAPGTDVSSEISLSDAKDDPAFVAITLALGDRQAREARSDLAIA